MSLTVLSVAYPFAPVTADPVGGAEQVLAQLDRALVAAGARSIVVAAEGSAVAGEFVSVPTVGGEIDDLVRARTHAAVRAAIAGVLARERVDAVHLHGIDSHNYRPEGGPPIVVSLHLPLGWYPAEALRPRPNLTLVPVSRAQADTAPPGVRLAPPIENGVDLDAFAPEPKQDYLLCLGRICSEKGFADALDAARLAGLPLKLAGEVYPYPEHRRHFEEEIAPRLDESRVFLGPVGGAEKRRLLARARAVLVPSTVPETSSLVAREALAAGTPVIARPVGALPEAVEHGVTGFLVETVKAMAEAARRAPEIDPAVCRRIACARFDGRRTAAAWFDLYRQLAGGADGRRRAGR